MSEPRVRVSLNSNSKVGTVKLTDLEKDIQEILLWRAGLLGHEGELTICFHHHNCLEMCLREEINTAVEYLDHISTGCKVKNKCLS